MATVAFSTTLGGVIGGYANESVGGSFMSGWIGGSFNGLVQSSAALAFPGAGKFIGAAFGGFAGSALTQAIDNFVPNGTRRSMAEVFTSSLIAGGISMLFAGFSKGVNYGINEAVTNGVAIGGRVITERFGKAMIYFFESVFDIISSFFNIDC